MMIQLFLSRRNLEALLDKLNHNTIDGVQRSVCTIIKNDTTHPTHRQTVGPIAVTAIEDDEYYIDREPGPVATLR